MSIHLSPSNKGDVVKAWAILGGLTALLGSLSVGVVLHHGSQTKNDLARLEAELVKWTAIERSAERVSDNLAAASLGGLRHVTTFYAESETQAGSRVQTLIRRSLERAGLELKSLEALDPVTHDAMKSIGVNVVFVAPVDDLNTALRELGSTTPRLTIDKVNIRQVSGNRRATRQSDQRQLEVRADIYAYMRPQP
jgi:hypothetical protein